MKIVKGGNDPAKRPVRGKCAFCGCVAECTYGETKWMQDDRPGDGTGAAYIDCPTCGKPLYVRHKQGRD